MAYENWRAFSAKPAELPLTDSHVASSPCVVARFSFRIENLPHIEIAFGPDVARAAVDHVLRLLTDLLGADGAVSSDEGLSLEVSVVNRDALGRRPLAAACRSWVEAVSVNLPRLVFESESGPICLWLSGSWAMVDASASKGDDTGSAVSLDRGEMALRFVGALPGTDKDLIERYRRAMGVAASVISSLGGGAESSHSFIALCWQPVLGPDHPARPMYYEARARVIAQDGTCRSMTRELAALEQVGFARLFDSHMVSCVLDELEACPDVTLAVNLSAQSMQADDWWLQVERRLRRNPSVAARLIFEVSETAVMPSIAEAARFAARMRQFGCQIALDGFGVGFASFRHLLALRPDLVKIDRFFIARAAGSTQDFAIFRHLFALAQSVAKQVIVEGVDDPRQAELAIEAGAHWQQGRFWGGPGMARPWASRLPAGQNPIEQARTGESA